MRIRLQVRDKYNDVVSTFEPGTYSLSPLDDSPFMVTMMKAALSAGFLVTLEDLDANH